MNKPTKNQRLFATLEELTTQASNGEYEYKALSNDELEVVCANCSFPVVEDRDPATGEFLGHHEEPAPKTTEEALLEGWTDHGLGLFCPKCSLVVLEDLARDREAGASSGASADIGEIIDAHFMRGVCPSASEDTIGQFVRMFRSERLSKFRVLAGLEAISIYAPTPKDEQQALEFLDLAAALKAAKEKKP